MTLALALCRVGNSSAEVRFPNRQQAAWSLSRGHQRLWASNEQPSSFAAGELVNLQPNECLRWRTDWHVTANGQPLPEGDYLLQWNTGAIRDANGRTYHDEASVRVGPGSSTNGIGSVTPRLSMSGALTRWSGR